MKTLWDETKILDMKMKNRFIRGGLWEELATEEGHMTEELFKVYEDLAKGGVGTIITGYTRVVEEEMANPRMMGIYNDSFIEEYKEFTDMVHSYGTNIIMQIAYGGSQTNYKTEERVIWGPSEVMHKSTKVIPKEMTKENIKYLIEAYGKAAKRIKKAGFDGVEIHTAHGYLLSQFLSPYYNRRADEYGGSIENRGRFLFEIYDEVRKIVGEDFPIWLKINSEDFMEDGLSFEDSMYIANKMVEKGIEVIEVSGGTRASYENMGQSRTKIFKEENQSYFRKYAIELSKNKKAKVALIGGNRSLEVMDKLLKEGIEYFSIARPLTAEPDLINKWKISDRNVRCVSCNKCFNIYGRRCILNCK